MSVSGTTAFKRFRRKANVPSKRMTKNLATIAEVDNLIKQ